MQKYRVIKKGSEDLILNSFEDMLSYVEDNPGFRIDYNIVEVAGKTRIKSESRSDVAAERERFMKSISEISRYEIEIGKKKVKYSKEIGFYIVKVGADEKEINITVSFDKKEKERANKRCLESIVEMYGDWIVEQLVDFCKGNKEDFEMPESIREITIKF